MKFGECIDHHKVIPSEKLDEVRYVFIKTELSHKKSENVALRIEHNDVKTEAVLKKLTIENLEVTTSLKWKSCGM